MNKSDVSKHLMLWLCESEVMNNVLSENKVENIVLFFTMHDESQNSLCVLRGHIQSVQHDLCILLDSGTSMTFISKELLSKLLLKYVWSVALKVVKFSNRSHNQVSQEVNLWLELESYQDHFKAYVADISDYNVVLDLMWL